MTLITAAKNFLASWDAVNAANGMGAVEAAAEKRLTALAILRAEAKKAVAAPVESTVYMLSRHVTGVDEVGEALDEYYDLGLYRTLDAARRQRPFNEWAPDGDGWRCTASDTVGYVITPWEVKS